MASLFLDLASEAVVGGDLPTARTANAAGSSVDFADVVGNMQSALLVTGAVSGTTPTLDVKIQHSSDGSTWADVTGATFTQVTTANRQLISFISTREFVRGYYTTGGTTPSFTTSLTFLGARRHNPANSGGFVNESGATAG